MILFICGAVTVLVLGYIFAVPGGANLGKVKSRLTYLRERKDAVYENLRDLNFEYRAGKIPDADYQSQKAALQEEAAALLAEISRLESSPQPRRARA